jgi:hypothetical protein
MKPKLTVGQTLWLVPYRHYSKERCDGFLVSVVKVGRLWATLDYPKFRPYRIDMESWCVDAGAGARDGKCYESEAAYLEYSAADSLWSEFRESVSRRYGCRDLTAGAIREAAKILGIDLDSPTA